MGARSTANQDASSDRPRSFLVRELRGPMEPGPSIDRGRASNGRRRQRTSVRARQPAAAEAAISCWDSKRDFSFWRPVTAIREANGTANPATMGAAEWEPLVNTPSYPDYTSGAVNVTTAMTNFPRAVLWHRRVRLHDDEQRGSCDPEDAHVQTFLRRRRRGCECPHPAWHSFPICGCGGAHAGQPRGELDLHRFLRPADRR